MGDAAVVVRQGAQAHDCGIGGGHAPLIRGLTQVVPIAGVALVRGITVSDVAVSVVRQLPTVPCRLEHAAGGAVALRCVAVVHVGDDAEGDGALTASVDLNVATAGVAQKHDRGGAITRVEERAALGVVRAELQARPVAERRGDGNFAHPGVRCAPFCPDALQQTEGNGLVGDVGKRGNRDVLLLAVRVVPARGLRIGENHALHGNLHLIGETFQLALRGFGGGGDEVGAAVDLELMG